MPASQTPPVPPPPPIVFPTVSARNLNGRPVELPGAFAGHRNLVVLAFQREQQAAVDSWSPAIAALLDRHADLRFYELPIINRGNAFFRAWLDSAMRGGIPDPRVREHTSTLYVDKPAFRQALDLPHEDTIFLLVLDHDGRVVWRAHGEYTEHAGRELERVLAEGL